MNKEFDFLIYNIENTEERIQVILKEDTIWLTQKAMGELFGVNSPAISKHLKNIFLEGELDENMVVSILENTTQHGAIMGKTQTKKVKYYNPTDNGYEAKIKLRLENLKKMPKNGNKEMK